MKCCQFPLVDFLPSKKKKYDASNNFINSPRNLLYSNSFYQCHHILVLKLTAYNCGKTNIYIEFEQTRAGSGYAQVISTKQNKKYALSYICTYLPHNNKQKRENIIPFLFIPYCPYRIWTTGETPSYTYKTCLDFFQCLSRIYIYIYFLM